MPIIDLNHGIIGSVEAFWKHRNRLKQGASNNRNSETEWKPQQKWLKQDKIGGSCHETVEAEQNQ